MDLVVIILVDHFLCQHNLPQTINNALTLTFFFDFPLDATSRGLLGDSFLLFGLWRRLDGGIVSRSAFKMDAWGFIFNSGGISYEYLITFLVTAGFWGFGVDSSFLH